MVIINETVGEILDWNIEATPEIMTLITESFAVWCDATVRGHQMSKLNVEVMTAFLKFINVRI